jgi:NAD(P)-dependent dehydrogenase (short-subunit alcohol dehydrogenase family)
VSDSEKTKFKKNVLISGGSRGIGKSAAYLLSRSDYQVLAPSSQELDQSSEKSVQDYFSQNFQDHEESLYGLIVNAGVYHSSCFEEYSFNDWQRVLDVNLNGAFHLVKAALPLLKTYVELNPESYSRIIFISSVSAYTGELYAPAYSASKAALIALAKSLALEFAKYKITVNSICPGWVKTDMALNQMPNEDSVKDSLGATLQNRWIEPEEIAHSISYLLSEPAKGITGQQLNITAGLDI